MSDCEVIFKAPKMKIEKCLQKSLAYDLANFKSTDPEEIISFIKLLLITNIVTERNYNNVEELSIFYDILFHMQHLKVSGIMDDENCECKFYCEVATR